MLGPRGALAMYRLRQYLHGQSSSQARGTGKIPPESLGSSACDDFFSTPPLLELHYDESAMTEAGLSLSNEAPRAAQPQTSPKLARRAAIISIALVGILLSLA